MIQLALAGFHAELSGAALAALQAEFAEFHTFQVRSFLDPGLLTFLLSRIQPADFKPRPHGKIAMELAVDSKTNIGVQSLQLRMNDKGLREFMEEVTQTRPLEHFEGRVYRMTPGTDHYDSWHDDVTEGRRIGMSINLSAAPYRGGTFMIKRSDREQVIRPMPNLGPGDAIFFRIDDGLHHMVSRMEGQESKTAFAGWFHDVSSLSDYLRRMSGAGAPSV